MGIFGRILEIVDRLGDPTLDMIADLMSDVRRDQVRMALIKLVQSGKLRQKDSDLDHGYVYLLK
uniref:Uncharacterized protein n=1 Tax=viral metagenome TaxID=1070528 RepID=A0A6M3LWG9_9ZZZZ